MTSSTCPECPKGCGPMEIVHRGTRGTYMNLWRCGKCGTEQMTGRKRDGEDFCKKPLTWRQRKKLEEEKEAKANE